MFCAKSPGKLEGFHVLRAKFWKTPGKHRVCAKFWKIGGKHRVADLENIKSFNFSETFLYEPSKIIKL